MIELAVKRLLELLPWPNIVNNGNSTGTGTGVVCDSDSTVFPHTRMSNVFKQQACLFPK